MGVDRVCTTSLFTCAQSQDKWNLWRQTCDISRVRSVHESQKNVVYWVFPFYPYAYFYGWIYTEFDTFGPWCCLRRDDSWWLHQNIWSQHRTIPCGKVVAPSGTSLGSGPLQTGSWPSSGTAPHRTEPSPSFSRLEREGEEERERMEVLPVRGCRGLVGRCGNLSYSTCLLQMGSSA